MKQIKMKLALVAFVIATGTSFAASTIGNGWYKPDYTPGATGSSVRPVECSGSDILCATHYNNGSADEQLFMDQN